MIELKVNGKEHKFHRLNVIDLLEDFNLSNINVVVEKNGEIVHREDYDKTGLTDGDKIELIRMVGGG